VSYWFVAAQFFAFFGYAPRHPSSLNSKKAVDYISYCDRTMVGWYHSDDLNEWGCFRSQKLGVSPWHPPQFQDAGSAKNKLDSDDVVAPDSMLEVASSVSSETDTNGRLFVADRAFVDAINNDRHSLWEARVPSELEGHSNEYVRQLTGASQFGKSTSKLVQIESKTKFDAQGMITGTHSIRYTKEDEEMEKQHKLPRSWDWGRVKQQGKDKTVSFLGPVRSQGHCGSCYAFATAAMAEARIRIRSNNTDRVVISPQHMLSCSRTNQGCLGGYPYLLMKRAHEIGFVPESCLEYAPNEAKCSDSCKRSDRYFASSDYGYLGGYYGSSSEVAMMKELVEHGPMVVALQAPHALFYYRRGILTCDKRPRHEPGWEETNHAVLLVGYGVDDENFSSPVKYWIIQNTWGTKFGDHGFFKIARGVDECGVEVQPVYMRLNKKVKDAPAFGRHDRHHHSRAKLIEMSTEVLELKAVTSEEEVESEEDSRSD
jgi:cathepsin C